MGDWIKNNGLSIVIASLGVIIAYTATTTSLNYRIMATETNQTAIMARQDRQATAIVALQSQNTDTLVALAKIQTDIDYIKIQLNKLVR